MSNPFEVYTPEPDKKKKLFEKGLLKIVQELHMSITGSYQDLTYKDMSDYVCYLSYRLRKWEPAHKSTQVYDIRVKDLIETVLVEYHHWVEGESNGIDSSREDARAVSAQ